MFEEMLLSEVNLEGANKIVKSRRRHVSELYERAREIGF